MTLLEIYQDCNKNGIDIDYYPMKRAKALAFPDGWIVVDVDKIENSVEEKEVIAHEEAHIVGGYFYNVYSNCDIKSRQERKAFVATIKKLVPLNELKEAVRCGITEHWELAEYFDVSDKFMLKAMEYYGSDITH